MANLPYSGVPDVAPQGAPSGDYQNASAATPNAFGAGLAQGLGQVSAGADTAMKFYGQVAADDATNNYMAKANALLYGDPTKKVSGPDGTMHPDTGYFGLKGSDAMSARADVSAKLDEYATEARDGLVTPESQLQFDSYTRKQRLYLDADVGKHADQQSAVWTKSVNQNLATQNINLAAQRPTDPTNITLATDGLKKAYVQQAQLDGTDPREAVMRADQDIALARVRATLPNDPITASRILKENSGILAALPEYDSLSDRVQARTRDLTAHTIADNALAIPVTGVSSGAVPRAENIAPLLQKAIPGLIVTGMERTPAENSAVGGVPNSAHTLDHAIDIRPAPGLSVDVLQRHMAALGLPDAKVIYEGPGAAHSTAPHFHVQWGAAAASTQPPASHANYIRQNFTSIQDGVRQKYLGQFPNDVEGADRAASLVDTKMRAFLTQDELRIKADYHALDTASDAPGSNGQKPTTVDQLLHDHPELRDNWENLLTTNAYVAQNFENRLLKANAMPANTTYGTGFYDLYGKVVSGQVKNASDLTTSIDPTKGDESRLTPEGYRELASILAKNGTPQGKADNVMLRNFFAAAHSQINPLQNESLGVFYPKGEQQFNHYMIKAMNDIHSEQAAGVHLSDILKEGSPVYNSRFSGHFVPTPAELNAARIGDNKTPGSSIIYDPRLHAAQVRDKTLRSARTADDLQAAFIGGKISKADRDKRALELHLWEPPQKTPAP